MTRKLTLLIAAPLLLWLSVVAAAAGPAAKAGGQKISPLSDSLRPLRKTPSFSAMDAFRRFSGKQGNGWRVRYSPRTALPEAITGGRTMRYGASPEEAAVAFLSDSKDLLRVEPSSLRLSHKKEFMGTTHLNYQQFHKGLPVEFSYVRVHVDGTGQISGYQAKFEPEINIPLVPLVTAEYAVTAAVSDLGRPLRVKKASLVIFPDEADGTLKLAWKILGRGGGSWVYYVDASSAKVLFKYDDLRYGASGTVTGTVYEISPIPTGNSDLDFPPDESLWTQPVLKPIRDQYVWVGGYSSFALTDAAGSYSSSSDGKVFASIKGPYFSVSNARGTSAHFDNGSGQWRSQSANAESPHPYSDSQTDTVTLTDDWTAQGYKFAKAMPHFSANTLRPFAVGALDNDGTVLSGDELHIQNPALTGNTSVGSYIGTRTSGFYGASVENPSYKLNLQVVEDDPLYPHEPYYGFKVDFSSYLVLTDAPGVSNNATGSVLWSTSATNISLDKSLDGYGASNSLAEVNAFYHLNQAHRYFDPINIDPDNPAEKGADLSGRVAVMVHASGEPDTVPYAGMQNAYYDFDHDNIMIGDGPMDGLDEFGKFRSFALDGTVVRHEYTHKVINQIYPIINFGEFGALSEAMADYFSLASFWAEGKTLSLLGNFLGGFAARDLSDAGGIKRMPDDWKGEVHDDSLMLSQALYSLRNGGARSLGTFIAAPFTGQPRADVFIFASLFYFPDNFANFRDALEMVCLRLEPADCKAGADYWGTIRLALEDHGIYSPQLEDIYEPNNGPAYATDAGTMSVISATIFPEGDADYYSFPLNQGTFTAKLTLPRADATEKLYSAFSLFLLDANRNPMAEVYPEIYDCSANNCRTESESLTLSYEVTQAGRYYLLAAVGPDGYYDNSRTVSLSPYTLNLDFTPPGSAEAAIRTPAFDGDIIDFSVPYARFNSEINPSTACASADCASAETVFEYAQLRDHNYRPLELTKTNIPGSYLELYNPPVVYSNSLDYLGRYKITGQVRLQSGFANRYPGVGTVYLEAFGRNRFNKLVSLGVSNAINLSTDISDLVTYNNVLNSGNSQAIIKYAVRTAGILSIKAYTQNGTLVKTIFEGSVPAGKGTVDWNGTNDNGAKAASGIYFIKSSGPGLTKVDKIAIVR